MNTVDPYDQFEKGFDCGWYGMTLDSQADVGAKPQLYHGPPMSDRLDPDSNGLYKIDDSTAQWPAERHSGAVYVEQWRPPKRIRPEDLGSGARGAWQIERALSGQDFGEPALSLTAIGQLAAKIEQIEADRKAENQKRADRARAMEFAEQVRLIMAAGVLALTNSSQWSIQQDLALVA